MPGLLRELEGDRVGGRGRSGQGRASGVAGRSGARVDRRAGLGPELAGRDRAARRAGRWRRSGDRGRGDGLVASGVGGRARAALAGLAAAVRAVRDAGRAGAARRAPVQDRRPRLRGAGLAGAPGRRAARGRLDRSRRCSRAVAHRRQLVLALKPLRQRLHDQLNALAPGPLGARPVTAARWSWTRRPGGRCWPARSLRRARAERRGRCWPAPAGRLTDATAGVLGRALEAAASPRRPTPSCAPRGSAATSTAGRRCARTSRSSTTSSSGCWPTAPARS